jgi:hypothetical protein
MTREQLAGRFNRLHQRVCEMLILEVHAHSVDQFLQEFVSALLMNAFVADHGELARPGSDENQHRVSFPRLFHAELPEFTLRVIEGIAIQFSPLNVDANLPRGFGFRFLDRPDDPIVIELAKKCLRSHEIYQLPLEPPPPNPPPPPLNPLKPPPDEELLDQPPPSLDQPPIKGPPKLE